MYGIYELAEGVAQIALPTPPGITRPFGFPYNVYVLHGDASAAVVGTGFAGSRDALLAALYELGVDPRRVQRVLLTSALPECAGNVELFERATVLGAGPSLELEATERAADVDVVRGPWRVTRGTLRGTTPPSTPSSRLTRARPPHTSTRSRLRTGTASR